MPIWLPAWKTLVNSASSSSRKQTKGCLLAVLPRRMTSLHPQPWLSATQLCAPGTRPLHGAVAVAVKGSRACLGHGTSTPETPKQTRELEQGAPHMRQDQFCRCTCPVAKEPSYFTSSQILRSFIYFFIYYISQLHLSSSFLLTSASSQRLS